MRLSKEMIRGISDAVAAAIESRKMARLLKPSDAVSNMIAEAITSDLMAEDELDKEVEGILSLHEAEIAKGGVDYRKLFEMTKHKLARERGIVL